ncbi:MAG: hypothetical protein HY655_13695 [Acidobacteria bacterium]|nr:hypothetical protein [Acidobacteriota bacterium]
MRLSFAGASWCLTGLLTAAVLSIARPAAPQFTPFSTDPRNILEGNWQSCLQRDGMYSERIYDHVVNGVGLFEVHMGPRREFAIFKDVQDEHRNHDSPDNLLGPGFRVVLEAGRAKQEWKIPALNLKFTATLAGGSRGDCESWFILLEPLEKTS